MTVTLQLGNTGDAVMHGVSSSTRRQLAETSIACELVCFWFMQAFFQQYNCMPEAHVNCLLLRVVHVAAARIWPCMRA